MKRIVPTLALALALATSAAQAAMTDWTEVQGGAVRLIASGPLKDGHYLAGLEFLLEPGWHTYWRYPGESGIPPQISIPDAGNVEDVEILYPAPERFDDGFSQSIVYHDGIVLPIRVIPGNPQEAVRFAVEVFFGVCNEICVPGDASLSLDLSPEAESDKLAAKLIARDLAAVPAANAGRDLEITSVTRPENSDNLVIKARVPGAPSPDLFAAGPEGSYIGLPELTGEGNGEATWKLPTKGLSVTDGDSTLRLVLSAGGKAVERLQPIDPDWVK